MVATEATICMLETLRLIYCTLQKNRRERRKKSVSVVHLQYWHSHKPHFNQSCGWTSVILAALDIMIWKELHISIDFASWSLNVYVHLYSFLADTLTHGCAVSRDSDTAIRKKLFLNQRCDKGTKWFKPYQWGNSLQMMYQGKRKVLD